VEKGVEPHTLSTSGAAFPGRQRMLCAWPRVAVYKGSGDVNAASSFACVEPGKR